MNRKVTFVLCAGAVLVLTLVTLGSYQGQTNGLSGKWSLTVLWEDGSRGTPTLQLEQREQKLSGTYSGGLGAYPIVGSVIGNKIRIEVQLSEEFRKANPKLSSLEYEGETDKKETIVKGTVVRPNMKGTFTGVRK